MTRHHAAISGTWLLFALVGCCTPEPGPNTQPVQRVEPSRGPSLLPIRYLRIPPQPRQDDLGLDRLPLVRVISDRLAYRALLRTHGWSRAKVTPEEVDFERDQIAFISWGWRPYSHFDLRVNSVAASADRVLIHLETVAPRRSAREEEGRNQSRVPFTALVIPRRPAVEILVGGDRLAELNAWAGKEWWLVDFSPSTISLRFDNAAPTTPTPTRVYPISGYEFIWPQVQVARRAGDWRVLQAHLLGGGRARVQGEGEVRVTVGEEDLPLARSPLARVDFTQDQIVLISYGTTPHSGYELLTHSVSTTRTRVVIEVQTKLPQPGSEHEDAEGCPTLALVVPNRPEIEVVVRGDRRADHADELERGRPDFAPGRVTLRLED